MTDYAVMFVPVSFQDFVFYNVICRGLVYVHSERFLPIFVMGLSDSLSESDHFLFCIDDEGRRTDKTALKEVQLPATNSRTFQGTITL